MHRLRAMPAAKKTWRPATVLLMTSVSLGPTQTVASNDDGFGEVCACAHDAECGAFRALSDEQRRARVFPLNPAFAVGETPAVYAAHSQQLSLAEVCPQIWPPPSHSTYWSKRKDKVRHTMQFYNQLANGQTFGLFENKLLMKRVYRCLDIPFMVPYFSAMVAQRPRVQPDKVEASNKYRQDSRINRETELISELNGTFERAEAKCNSLLVGGTSRVKCPIRSSSATTTEGGRVSSRRMTGAFAPYSRCALKTAIEQLHSAALQDTVLLKPSSSTMSQGVTVWEQTWKAFLERMHATKNLTMNELIAVSQRRMLQLAEDTMMAGLTCCLSFMAENYKQVINHRGILIEPRYDIAKSNGASLHIATAPTGQSRSRPVARPVTPTQVWELKFVVLAGVTQDMHALQVPLGRKWVHFERLEARAAEEWRCALSPSEMCEPLLAQINDPENMARIDAWALRLARFFGAEWFRMDVFTGNKQLGWQVNEVAYVDATYSPRTLDRLFAMRCNTTQKDLVMLPPDDFSSSRLSARRRGPLHYIASDASLPLDVLTSEPIYKWTSAGVPWIFDSFETLQHTCDALSHKEKILFKANPDLLQVNV